MTTDWKAIVNTKTEEEAAKVIHDLYEKGASSMDIAKACGVTDVSIRNLFKKYKLKVKSHGGLYRGKKCDITEEEYTTMTYKALAEKYNVSAYTVWARTKKYRK